MADKAEVIKIKLARKRILEHLNILYPTPITLGSLYNTIIYSQPDYEDQLYRKDIEYLRSKGYITTTDPPLVNGRFAKKIVHLTAEGKEIAEATQSDPALEI